MQLRATTDLKEKFNTIGKRFDIIEEKLGTIEQKLDLIWAALEKRAAGERRKTDLPDTEPTSKVASPSIWDQCPKTKPL